MIGGFYLGQAYLGQGVPFVSAPQVFTLVQVAYQTVQPRSLVSFRSTLLTSTTSSQVHSASIVSWGV